MPQPNGHNQMQGNNTDWGVLLEARERYEASRTAQPSSGIGAGRLLLIGGAAALAIICIVMVLTVG